MHAPSNRTALRPSESLAELFGLEGLHYVGCGPDPQQERRHLLVDFDAYSCCRAQALGQPCQSNCVCHGVASSTFDLPRIQGMPATARIRRVRLGCPGEAERYDLPPGLRHHPWRAATSSVIENCLDALEMPIAWVARRNGHGHRKVTQQFDAFGTLFHQRHPPCATRFMGMDSSGFARGKYTLVNQVVPTKRGPARRDTEEASNSYVLDVVQVTTAEEIAADLQRMDGIEEVEAVATDLSPTLLKALRLSCPQAAHVGDRHHFAKDFHRPLASIRRSYGHVIKPRMFAPVAEGRLRERVKWLIDQRWHALAPKDQEELLFYLDQCPLLEAGYWLKEEAMGIFDLTSVEEADDAITALCASVTPGRPEHRHFRAALETLGGTWRASALNAVRYRITTGHVERRHQDVGRWDVMTSGNLPVRHIRTRARAWFGPYSEDDLRAIAADVAAGITA